VEEHARRSTTSVNDKISTIRKCSTSVVALLDSDEDSASDSELDKQEDYRPEDDDEEEGNAGDDKSFFSSSDGASFSDDSFCSSICLAHCSGLVRPCGMLNQHQFRVHSMIEKLAQFTDIRSCLIVGGLSTKVSLLFQFQFHA
ncbi:hypothetical protein RYX36_016531, partial [Vicia faba]